MNDVKLCVNTVSCPTTGIDPIEASLNEKMYPQPAIDNVVIELPNASSNEIFSLKIINLNGRILRTESFNGNRKVIDRKDLNSGFYILNVTSDSGKEYNTKLTFR